MLAVAFSAISPSAFAQFYTLNTAPSIGPSAISDAPNLASFRSVGVPIEPLKPAAPGDSPASWDPLQWFVKDTFGPRHMVGGVLAAGFGTAIDRPGEYGPHWKGFADRYDARLSGIATGNAIEAGVGYLLHENPRYFRSPDQRFKARVRNVLWLTLVARSDDGSYGPAYARYLAISGNNFLSNTWRTQSEANVQSALIRIAEGFAGRMAANAFEEFWPEIGSRFFRPRE